MTRNAVVLMGPMNQVVLLADMVCHSANEGCCPLTFQTT
jgi:hypothetical protein